MALNPKEETKLNFFFYRFVGSRMLNNIAMNAFLIFYMWIVVSKYHSVFLAGMIVAIYTAVDLISSLPIGHLIDRFNNTYLNFLSNFLIIAGFILLLFGENLFYIYSATILSIFGSTLKGDSFSGIIKKHVPEDKFKKANSVTFLTGSISSLIGTFSGGLSIIFLRGDFAYFLLSLLTISIFLSIPAPEALYNQKMFGIPLSDEFKSVGKFLIKLVGFLIVAFFLNGLFISLDTYSSGLFNIVLKSNPLFYTIFGLSVPLGMIGGTPLANVKYFRQDRPIFISLMLFIFSPFIIVLSFSRSPIIDIIDAFIIGLILPIINIPIQTKAMKVIPRDIFGKVSAFIKIFTQGASPVMGTVFAFLSIFLSITSVLFLVGILVIPLGIYGIFAIPKFFKLG